MKKNSTSSRFRRWIRDLHLHLGLFVSPFLLVYAASTIFLNHSVRPTPKEVASETVPLDLDGALEGEALVSAVLKQLGLSGEIGGRGAVRNGQTVIRVARPGRIKIVTVDLEANEARVVERSSGLLGALNFLHFNPGMHRAPNWGVTKIWGWLADSTVYVTLFLTASGIYLWALMKAERKNGLLAMGAGLAVFVSLLAALIVI